MSPQKKQSPTTERVEPEMEEALKLSQKSLREVHLLREELLEVEEARYCAMRTIEYLENRHPKKQD